MNASGADDIARPRIDPARGPFQRTATYRHYGPNIEPAPLDPEQLYSKPLIHEQGFDGPPHVVSSAELDAYVQAGEFEDFRGIAGPRAAEYAERLRTGPMWVGRGGIGGGIYAAVGADAHEHAAIYAQDPGSVLGRLTVKGTARLARLDELDALLRRQAGRTLPADLLAGMLAAYLGYVGVVEPNGVLLVLNRTAVRIQRENVEP